MLTPEERSALDHRIRQQWPGHTPVPPPHQVPVPKAADESPYKPGTPEHTAWLKYHVVPARYAGVDDRETRARLAARGSSIDPRSGYGRAWLPGDEYDMIKQDPAMAVLDVEEPPPPPVYGPPAPDPWKRANTIWQTWQFDVSVYQPYLDRAAMLAYYGVGMNLNPSTPMRFIDIVKP